MSPVDLAGPPRRRVCRDRGTARRCGLGATRGAQTGGVRPRPLRGAASHEAEGRSGAAAPSSPRAARPPGVADSPRVCRPLVPPMAMWATVWGVFAGMAAAAGWRAVCRLWAWRWAGGARSCLETLVGGSWAAPWAGGVRPLPPPATRRCREARASLRGGASHEAEGRRDARAGGADRVGPPTGWYRLRLLRQIGDQLVPGVEQFLLINNVVAVEDGAALMPGQEHGDALGDVRADQVARGSSATIVEEAGRHPGRLTGGAPRRAPAANGNAVAVKDQRAVGVAACPPPRQGLGDGL